MKYTLCLDCGCAQGAPNGIVVGFIFREFEMPALPAADGNFIQIGGNAFPIVGIYHDVEAGVCEVRTKNSYYDALWAFLKFGDWRLEEFSEQGKAIFLADANRLKKAQST